MVLGAQLARHRAEDARADRLHLRIDQHRGIAVETDDRTVGALDVFRDAHDDGLHHVALLHAAARYRLLHRNDDDVADGGVFALRTAQHLDAHDAARAGIVRHIKIALHLDHGLPQTVFTTPPSGGFFLLAADHRPAFKLGDGPVFFNPHHVADLELVVLVVRVVFLRPAHRLLEQRVGVTALDAHHQG